MSKTKIIHPKIDNETIEIKSKVKQNVIKTFIFGRNQESFSFALWNFNRNATSAFIE